MRILVPVLALALMAGSATAQQPPPGAAAREAALVKRMGPQSRAFIQREARREMSRGEANEATARAAAGAYGPTLGAMGGRDIDALVFLILMQVNQDAEADLRQQMADMKKAQQQKAALRQQHGAVSGAPHQPPGPPVSPRALASIQDNSIPIAANHIKDRLDSQSELSEPDSMRLQMAMDRRAKMVETLSNLIKKIDSTDEGIVGNLK